jgi:hypothetical protein
MEKRGGHAVLRGESNSILSKRVATGGYLAKSPAGWRREISKTVVFAKGRSIPEIRQSSLRIDDCLRAVWRKE